MNDFLSNDYKVPQSGGKYVKLAQGNNVFRILSAPVMGWVWWVESIDETGMKHKTPKRVKSYDEVKHEEIGINDSAKHFWALMVYNHNASQIQMWEITQQGIQQAIVDLHQDTDWGDPRGYDINVKRSGEGKQTNYIVQAKPKTELSPDIKKQYEDMNINLEDLFTGKDIFAKQTTVTSKDESEPDMSNVPF